LYAIYFIYVPSDEKCNNKALDGELFSNVCNKHAICLRGRERGASKLFFGLRVIIERSFQTHSFLMYLIIENQFQTSFSASVVIIGKRS